MTAPDKPVQVGTVELLDKRVYPVDPDRDVTDVRNASVVVPPGVYPVYRQHGRLWWVMRGRSNEVGTAQDLPYEGMFTIVTHDRPGPRRVTVTSKKLDAAEFAALLAEPVCTAGHPGQRLRIRPLPGRRLIA